MKVLVYGHILSVYHITSHHITSCHMSKIILASCFANVRSWLSRVQSTQIAYSKHAGENVNILIPWVERLKIGFAKKKQPFALCIRYTYMKWDGEFLLGTASMLLEARPFLSRASTSIVQKVKLRQVWDWLTSLGLSQER